MNGSSVVEHFFRHEYGRLVAVMVRRFGVEHLQRIEDAAQEALLRAVESWGARGAPEAPSAWLYRVAQNALLSELRNSAVRHRHVISSREATEFATEEPPDLYLESEVQDGTLRMLLLVCRETIPQKSQLVFALRTLCGFSTSEVALRLFLTEANVHKRYQRAKGALQSVSVEEQDVSPPLLPARLSAVRHVLYLLFSEGHLSSAPARPLRWDLCVEALRLARILAKHPLGQDPETSALVAMMYLHLARFDARADGDGGLLLLEEQDRALYRDDAIVEGLVWLERSAHGGVLSRYHAEAGIAAEHALAPSVSETRWDRIAECYEMLESLAPSPLHRLGRALAVAESSGEDAGLSLLRDFDVPRWLSQSYLWDATLAELHRRASHIDEARIHLARALKRAPSEEIRRLIVRRHTAGNTP